ncbi:cache domain-containing protein [Dongia soli]|uniref:histidine kinase n=1 Tax=Dongia soli TaxID=600628 RepID=A0ABU5E5N7_9PROT|nr:cache domain-containing protein [Dongia soli]MDY0881620.1 cache domain-containing protein [Dongia soli]
MRQQLFDSLRYRLVLIFALAVLIPSLFGIIVASRHYANLMEAGRASIARYGALVAEDQRHILQRNEQLVRGLARDPAILAAAAGQDSTQCAALLAAALKPYPSFSGAVLANLDGEPICYPAGQKGALNVAQSGWFKRVVSTGNFVLSGSLIGRISNQPVFVLAAPVLTSDGHLLGVLALDLRIDWLTELYSGTPLPESSSLYILDDTGKAVVELTSPGAQTQQAFPASAEKHIIRDGMQHEFGATGRDGVDRFYTLIPVTGYPLYVLLGMPLADLQQSPRNSLFSQILVLCLISATGIGVALVGTRLLITQWTERLTQVAYEISQGNLAPEIRLTNAPRELRNLGETLGGMAQKIHDRDAALNEMVDQRQRMLRELHHRIKNNLQIVISFLSLYSRLPMSDQEHVGISDLQLRVSALALAQRHLYEKEDMKSVALQPFVDALCNLLGGHLRKRGDIQLRAEIAKQNLNIDKVVPLALVITEIVCSGVKSFSEQSAVAIRLNLTSTDNEKATLVISFSGVALTPRSDYLEKSSLGASLVRALAKQLGGDIESTESNPGAATIRFFLHEEPANPADIRKEA